MRKGRKRGRGSENCELKLYDSRFLSWVQGKKSTLKAGSFKRDGGLFKQLIVFGAGRCCRSGKERGSEKERGGKRVWKKVAQLGETPPYFESRKWVARKGKRKRGKRQQVLSTGRARNINNEGKGGTGATPCRTGRVVVPVRKNPEKTLGKRVKKEVRKGKARSGKKESKPGQAGDRKGEEKKDRREEKKRWATKLKGQGKHIRKGSSQQQKNK